MPDLHTRHGRNKPASRRTPFRRKGGRPRPPAGVWVAIYVESNAFLQFRHGRSRAIAPTKSFYFYYPLQQQIYICTTHRGFDSAQPPGPLPERSRRQHLRQIFIWRTYHRRGDRPRSPVPGLRNFFIYCISHRRDAMHCVSTIPVSREFTIHHIPKDRNP